MDTDSWQMLMDRVVAYAYETADYVPGSGTAPGAGPGFGSGQEGADPMGLRYANMGHLALVTNEAVDAMVNSGADRDALLDSIADAAGEKFERGDVDDILSGKLGCPEVGLLQAFANGVSIDYNVMLDAAIRGGCSYTGTSSYPPGM